MAPSSLLIVNPNIDRRVTGWLAAEARRVAGTALNIDAVNAASGLAALSTPQHVAQAEQAVIDAVLAHPVAGAVLIGAFGDPGVADLRKRKLSSTVIGLGEAGLRAAAAGGRRFAVVTLGAGMEEPLRVRLSRLGLLYLLTVVTTLPIPIERFVASRGAQTEILAHAIRYSFAQSDTRAVLLGGAPFAGLAGRLQPQFDKPVLDGVASSVSALGSGLIV